MLVEELIQKLCDAPDDLLEELKAKYAVLCREQKDLDVRMSNLRKVIRITTDVRCRLARNEEEIGALHEQLVQAKSEGLIYDSIDLTSLYALTDMPEKPSDTDY